MRVGIQVARLAVGRPSGMADSAVTDGAALLDELFTHILELALGLYRLYPGLFENRNTGTVISAVFQLLKSVHKYVGAVALTDIAYYSAHYIFLRSCISVSCLFGSPAG